MLELVGDFLFGWIFDLLPFDISQARRERRYKRRERVFLVGHVTGVPGAPRFADYLAAQQGQLWVSTRRREDGDLYPIPRRTGQVVILRKRATWKEHPALAFDANWTTVQIACPMSEMGPGAASG